MNKYTVQYFNASNGTTVLAVAACHFSQQSNFLVFSDNENCKVAALSVDRVICVTKEEEDPVKAEAPELPTLSRKHPVYAYGKGDLVSALKFAQKESYRGSNMGAYLGDIIRDLHIGR